MADDSENTATDGRSERGKLRRTMAAVALVSAISVVVSLVLVFALYRAGVFDSYIKGQFTSKLSDIGIEFQADRFRVTASPMTLELENATFNNKTNGEKLFSVKKARLGLTVIDLLSWRLSRDISIDTTDINGAEVWLKFDEQGRSNFSGLKLVEDQKGSAVNFRIDSTQISVTNSVVHFGDLARSISANAGDLALDLTPDHDIADRTRFAFNLTSRNTDLTYGDSKLKQISFTATGVADDTGADISQLFLSTPLGDTLIGGRISDWSSPKYDLRAESTLDLTQLSNTFATGTALRGIGNFKGHIIGHGEEYRIDGTADSQSFRADGVYLKGANIAATVEGTNDSYYANGTAIAEMLTFDDFRLDFLKATGNVRGTGTDFRWLGELQAIAAKTPSMTIGGLFLADSIAEYRDRQLAASAENGRAKKFAIGDTEFEDLRARNLKFSAAGGNIDVSVPSAATAAFKTPDYRIDNVTGRNVRVRHRKGQTDIDAADLRSQKANIAGANVDQVSASKLQFRDALRTTSVVLNDLRAGRAESDGTVVDGIETPQLNIDSSGGTATIYADRTRVARIDTGSAVLGSLNIAGVRLTIRSGTIEGRSDDIDAGNIALLKTAQNPSGGTLESVKIARPIFIVERSGRYRASADMSIGGGALGSVALGRANAKVVVTNERAELTDVTATVMNGQVRGRVDIAFNSRNESSIEADFADIDLSKLAAVQSGRVMPIEGKTNGNARLTFAGTNFRSASGTLNADIAASAGTAERGLVPVNGRIELSADTGLFTIKTARLNTDNSKLIATGRFDLKDSDSDLTLDLASTDAAEIDKIIRVTGVAPELERQFDELQVNFAGDLTFKGKVTGNLFDPKIDGNAAVASVGLRGRTVGRVTADLLVSDSGFELNNGKLNEPSGGNADFTLRVPSGTVDGTSISAELFGVNAGNLLAALPLNLPERIRNLDGSTSGKLRITGLPNKAEGEAQLSAAKGTIAGQNFDDLKVNAEFRGTVIDIRSLDMAIGSGRIKANGSYDRGNSAFAADITAKQIPVPLVLALLPRNDSIPAITGTADFTLSANGNSEHYDQVIVNGNGIATGVNVGDSFLGDVIFEAKTADQKLSAGLTVSFDGRPQVVSALIDLSKDDLPLTASTDFNESPVAPFLAFVPQLKGIAITGTGTGRIDFGGTLSAAGADGKRVISADRLKGIAQFSTLTLQINDTPLAAADPVVIRFDPDKAVFDSAHFTGGGSNVSISGTKALTAASVNDLSVNGRMNLSLLNLATKDTFFAGTAEVAVRLYGPNTSSRLSGTATTENASVAAFMGTDRITFERVKTKVIFTSDQAEIESASGFLGGGRFTASGGALLDGLSVKTMRFSVVGDNITVPLPADFITTGDARLEVTGIRRVASEPIQLTIAGRVFANRSVYSKDIDLANIVGARRERTLAAGASSVSAPRFDLVIEGRDALVVRNNIADLTASVTLTLTGDADNPILSGRITATSGTLFYRRDRYDIQRGVLEFPPDTTIDPVINLQAESEISGYQVFVNLNGPLNDTELLTATVRSSPSLPQADIVSLITTGSLTNAAGGIPTLAQTGIRTAAEILTDSVINNPARKATDKLFGLNVFEIDPIISGQQLSPGARLTVGRQINNNLRVTYSTNLSQDQNQVLALEYRISNKLSFVAQYEQRSLSNVTRNRDNFSFEIRFKKRF